MHRFRFHVCFRLFCHNWGVFASFAIVDNGLYCLLVVLLLVVGVVFMGVWYFWVHIFPTSNSSLPARFRLPSIRIECLFRVGVCVSLIFSCLCFPHWLFNVGFFMPSVVAAGGCSCFLHVLGFGSSLHLTIGCLCAKWSGVVPAHCAVLRLCVSRMTSSPLSGYLLVHTGSFMFCSFAGSFCLRVLFPS